MRESCGALAVIPARGGSKGIPRKNLSEICGRSLVEHAIRAALGSHHVARVIVTTDDAEIARVSTEAGAEIIMRPAELSTDTASSEAALLHVLDELAEEAPEFLVMIQCTSPLTLPEDIDRAFEDLIDHDADSVFTATLFHHFLWSTDEAMTASPINHDDGERKRRQDLRPQYLENGAIYAMHTGSFRQTGRRFCGRTTVSLMPSDRCWEIDTADDLEIVERRMCKRECDGLVSLPTLDIKAIVLDFDGVLTDNHLLLSEDGHESVRLNRSDGLAVGKLRRMGLEIAVLSGERNPVVAHRCAKLGIESFSGIDDKLPVLTDWAERKGFGLEQIVYVGNDENDVECFRAVGAGLAVADARPAALRAARRTLRTAGGEGVVCEIVQLLEDRQIERK